MKGGLAERTVTLQTKHGKVQVALTFPRKTWLQRISDAVPLVISLLALATAVVAQWQTIRHNKLSVRPHLAFLVEDNFAAANVGLFIENDGLGPGRIERLSVYFDGQLVEPLQMDSIYGKTRAIFRERSPQWYTADYLFQVKSGERMGVFFSAPANVKNLGAFEKLIEERIFVIGKACSLYEECQYFCSVGPDERCLQQEQKIRRTGLREENKPLL